MKKLFLILVSVLSFTLYGKGPVIEHQIRLCEDGSEIVSKLNLGPSKGDSREIYYIETRDRFYQNNGWSIRLRKKLNKVEVTIKKNMLKNDEVPSIEKLACEFDRHGDQIEKKCKLNEEVTIDKFEEVRSHHKNWITLLSDDQQKWLKSEKGIISDAILYGLLKDQRFELNDKAVGKITIDLVHLSDDDKVTFHEMSIRYPLNESDFYAQNFSNIINLHHLILCPNQIDWSVNKFDVLSEF